MGDFVMSLYFLCNDFFCSLSLNVGLDHMALFWQKALLFFIINKLFCSLIKKNIKKAFSSKGFSSFVCSLHYPDRSLAVFART